MTGPESCKREMLAGIATVPGIVLAGGLSRRMGGGDKALRMLDGKPLLFHVILRFSTQVAPLAINANGDPSRFAGFGLPVVPDATADFAGPLAGILAGLRWAASAAPDALFLATAACDTPFFPGDLVSRLMEAANGEAGPRIACARSAGRLHPAFALWPIGLADGIATALARGQRKVTAFAESHSCRAVEFPPHQHGGALASPFFNVNTSGELAEAEALLRAMETP
jgi:molybdopterin-guanine dinucleotide biosynthesis protein A